MGRQMESFKVTASLSSHNSEQDDIDEALWEDLCEKIKALAADPKYAGIGAPVIVTGKMREPSLTAGQLVWANAGPAKYR